MFTRFYSLLFYYGTSCPKIIRKKILHQTPAVQPRLFRVLIKLETGSNILSDNYTYGTHPDLIDEETDSPFPNKSELAWPCDTIVT